VRIYNKSLQINNLRKERPLKNAHIARPEERGRQGPTDVHDLARTMRTQWDSSQWSLLQELFPICRSLTGNGVRATLSILKREVPELTIREIASGTRVFDWTVPDEWNIRGAFLEGPDGKVVDFKDNNLHVVGYSEPVDAVLDLDALWPHLYSLESQPDAIPYVTSYYERRWGFCLTHKQKMSLRPGKYRAVIDSTLQPGSLTYADCVLPGKSDREILFSTYVCHPSLANDNLSGPVVAVALLKWLKTLNRQWTYRFVFVPETIGAIAYLQQHQALLTKTLAGFVLTCVGDDGPFSYLPSRAENTLADKAILNLLQHEVDTFKTYSYLDRGSDERQYCSPGIDLPVATLMRSKYGTFPEYHTSLDNLNYVTENGLTGSFSLFQKLISVLENNLPCQTTMPCEPQLGKRQLYNTLSQKGSSQRARTLLNFLAYCDGHHTLLDIAQKLNLSAHSLIEVRQLALDHSLVTRPFQNGL